MPREAARRSGLLDAPDAAIPDPRLPEMIRHDREARLAQRVTASAPRHEDLNDHQTLRPDPAPQLAAGKPPDPATTTASPPTSCRLEDRADRPAPVRIADVLLDPFIPSPRTPPEHPIPDLDASDDPARGRREGRFSHGYHDHHRFLPPYVFAGDEPPVAPLRPGKIDAAGHPRAVLELPVERLRAAWPEVEVAIRAGSGFRRWKLMRWCDSHGIGHVPGWAGSSRPEALALGWTARARRRFERTQGPQRPFGPAGYAARGWDRSRRVIVRAEHEARGADPRPVVSDVPGDPEGPYDEVNWRRGEMEDRIEEQEPGLFAGRASCHRFAANRFRLPPSSAAHVVVQASRREALAGTELARAQVTAIRSEPLEVAARAVIGARRVVSRPAGGDPYQAPFAVARGRSMGGPAAVPEAG